MRRVGQVVKLRAKFEVSLLVNSKDSKNGKIIIDNAGPPDRVSPGGAKTVGARLTKCCRVKPELTGPHTPQYFCLAEGVCKIPIARAVTGGRIRDCRKRRTGNSPENPIELPTSHHMAQRPRIQVALPRTEGEFVNVTQIKHVSSIEIGRAVIGPDIDLVGKTRLVTTHIHSLAVGVGGCEAEAV